MRVLKRVLAVLGIVIIVFSITSVHDTKNVNAQINGIRQNYIKIDVLLYNSNDKFISLVRQNLEEIQKQNKGKVEFEFFDGKGNQAVQNETISQIFNSRVDILLVNLVDTQAAQDVIDKFRNKSIPIIFFNREPVQVGAIKSYSKAYYVGTNAEEAGKLQGEIISDFWNKNREIIDKNKNGMLEYVILKGQHNNIESNERTDAAISAINNAGIKTKELAVKVANWDVDLGRITADSLFLNFGNKIEAIISNNDAMAIGAIEAIQKYGFNKGDESKYIAVFGIDALPEAKELIKQGVMAGTVIQDPLNMAQAIYAIGMNVFQGDEPLYNTQYMFDDTKIAVRLPYKKYIG